VLDRLERRALITREGDPNDRRAFVIALSRRGGTVAAKVHRALLALERAGLAGLSLAKRALVADALDALAAAAGRVLP